MRQRGQKRRCQRDGGREIYNKRASMRWVLGSEERYKMLYWTVEVLEVGMDRWN